MAFKVVFSTFSPVFNDQASEHGLPETGDQIMCGQTVCDLNTW